ncbi:MULTISPECIES: hypothetical protein [Psychrilyobacter]|uniref:Uncharacterized protein n=1 Tax=Psychrilyobacter piezotolerans TaxID=2293438 RepID=A0ABX9KDF8_9FUSO|nr:MULTISPECIES: hypothetical protein [Psychrilyobacter]MCS5423176.1 hypothetical protein [Psychrilyobacter sp. S5]NDI79295.1 hypothetical protein [Psychrilyobacter piezotolerans]RDE58780.1 hypothetical protein DV867_15500 [Psychrilyobacter sp. S5]REI39256.1 hypothetical protein DYH56_15500 [Psychrilyobacter piezotolerans]
MEFDIVKIIIYLVIARMIISRINKKKKNRSNTREDSTPETPDKQRRTGMQKRKDRNIDVSSFRDVMPKSDKPLSGDERMKQREKELENRNKR